MIEFAACFDGSMRGGDVSTKADMDAKDAKRRHKRWPEALKREIVAATLQLGAWVSVVAHQYDVNANQVFSCVVATARRASHLRLHPRRGCCR